MPIGTAVAKQSFDDQQLSAMGIAFEQACGSLRLAVTQDPLTDIVADKIIEAARSGESDPARLYAAVMHWASAG